MRKTLISLLCVLLLLTLRVESRSFYVALNGSNSHPGTITQPWRTLSYAAGSSSGVMAGDTIYVRGGNYPESIYPAISGTASLPIVICPYMQETVTLNPGRFRFNSGVNYWKIVGFALLRSDDSGVYVSGVHAIDFLTVQKCTISHHQENGICLLGAFGGVVIQECIIEFNGEATGNQQPGEGHGIVIYGGGPGKLLIKRNLIANNWHKGIAYGSSRQFHGNGTVMDSNMIINNYESGCDFSPDSSSFRYNYLSGNGLRDTENEEFGDKGFMTTPYCEHSTIAFNVIRSSGGNEIAPLGRECYYYNNTLYKDVFYTAVPGSSYQAIMTFYDDNPPNSVFRNNIFVNMLSQPHHHFAVVAEVYSSYSNQIWSNNLYWCPNASVPPPANKPFKLYNAPGPGGMYKTLAEVQASWPSVENHSLYVAPGFISIPDSNFALLPGSPAIDAGVNVGFPYHGQAPDIGRFEFCQGNSSSPKSQTPPLLNSLFNSGAVLTLKAIGAEHHDVVIDPFANQIEHIQASNP